MKREIVQELVTLADSLDKHGMRKQADALDHLLKIAIDVPNESGLMRLDDQYVKWSNNARRFIKTLQDNDFSHEAESLLTALKGAGDAIKKYMSPKK
jgi:hypothetical protein